MSRSFLYSAISAGSAGLMLLLLIVAGRSLGVADYGDFVYAITVATIAEALMDLGLHQVTIRAIARDRAQAGRLLHTSIWLKLLPGVGMIVAFGVAVFVLRPEPSVRLACLLMLGSAAMRSFLLTARGILQGLEQFGPDAVVTTLDRLLLLVACATALWFGASVVQLSAVFLVVRIATAVGGIMLARSHAGPGSFDRTLSRTLPGEALPVGLFLLVLNLYNRVDTVMLGSLAGQYDTGLYGSAYQIYEGFTYAAAVASSVLIPRLSRLFHEDTVEYRRVVLRSLVGTGVLGAVLALAGWPLATFGVRLAFGREYDPAGVTVRCLLLGLPFVYVIWVLHGVALAADRPRVLLWVTGTGTVLNIALNFVLIPRASYNGSAIATVISEAVAMSLLLYGLRGALRGERGTPA